MLKTPSGKVVGTYDRATNKVTLYKGATVDTLVHEMGGHATMQFAQQCAKAGNDTLLKKVNESIDTAPTDIWEAVKGTYKKNTNETEKEYNERLRDEVWAAIVEKKSEAIEAAKKTEQGQRWWKKAWNAIKACWAGVLGRMGVRVDWASKKVKGMNPDAFTDFIVKSVREGRTIGNIRRGDGETGVRNSYGVPYQGSKSRIAKSIVDVLPKGKRIVDLFSGGGAMTHAAMESGKYGGYRMNDLDGKGQRLFLEGAQGKWDNYNRTGMTEEEFAAIKGTPESLPWSFNGLGRNLAKTSEGGRDKAAEQIKRVKSLSSLKGNIDKVEASEKDYRNVKLRNGDVVYADIPYEQTDQRGYGKGMGFDKDAFVKWAQKQSVPVYVSEYTMPEGWTEVSSFDVPGMRGGERKEKLFVQSKFAGKHRKTAMPRSSVVRMAMGQDAADERMVEFRELLAKKFPDKDASEIIAELGKINSVKKQREYLRGVLKGD